MFDLKKNKLKDWLYFIKLERDIFLMKDNYIKKNYIYMYYGFL